MIKKILCAIMSAIMVVGSLTGCGSSSGDTSKETSKETSVEDRTNELEQTVLTQITPGKSKVDDVKAFLKSQGVTFSANSSYISGTTFGLFLEHECNYEEFEFDKEEKITSYGVEIGFEDAKDYSHSYQEISDYVEKLSLGVTGEVNDDEDVEGVTEWGTEEGEKLSTYYLVDDSDDYMTIIEFSAFSNFYKDWDGYNTLIAIEYTYIPKKNIKPSDSDGIYNWVWKDKNGKEYTPKVIKNIQKNKGNDLEDSTESIYREDSTEASQQENSDMSAWKQAYIDYINGLDGKVTGYKFVDVNSDGQPELCIEYTGGIDAELLNYTKSGDVQSISAMHADSEFAYGDGKIVDGIMRTGVASDRVYSYNSSTGEFDVIFNGQYNGYDTDTPNNYCLGTQNMEQMEQVTKEEYESKLKEARGNTEYTWLWGDFLTDDVIAAIQKTEASQQENSNLTAEKQAYDVEEEVNKIRDIYYWVQGDSSNLTKQDGGSVTRWIDSNGKIRKIVAPAGTYDDTNGADAAKYNAEFYYNENEELVFVFLYSGKEEHRLYVVQGKCVRYIDQDRSVNDYPELKEADSVCGLGYFIGLGMMEIHYAYV